MRNKTIEQKPVTIYNKEYEYSGGIDEMRVKNKGRFITFIVLVLAIIIVGAKFLIPALGGDGGQGGGLLSPEPEEPKLSDPVELSILCAGDVMAHSTQLTAQQKSDGSYDFSNNYIYIKPYIEAADVAICNVETTFAGAPYTGYPAFCAPDSLAECLKEVGFDVASTSNNHMLDKGISGAMRTLEVLQSAGIKTTGAVTETTDPRYAIFEAKGVKVGVVAYTYQNTTQDRSVSINGNHVSAENAAHINSFNYNFIDEELAKIGQTVDEARAAGADIVVVFYHWGEEYQLKANKWQTYMAEQTVANMDVDVVFGSHPHVLQNAEMYGKDMLVARDRWGHYLSDQALADLMEDEGMDVVAGSAKEIAAAAKAAYTDACVAGGLMIPVKDQPMQWNMPAGSTEDPAAAYEQALAEATAGILPKGVTMQYEHKNVPVYFSLGNLISNQRAETLDNKYTEEGVLAQVKLTFQPETGEVLAVEMGGITTWVDRYSSGGHQNYYVIPLDENLESNETLKTSGHLSRARDAMEVARGILGID